MAQEKAAGQPSPTEVCWSQPFWQLWFIGESVVASFVFGSGPPSLAKVFARVLGLLGRASRPQ